MPFQRSAWTQQFLCFSDFPESLLCLGNRNWRGLYTTNEALFCFNGSILLANGSLQSFPTDVVGSGRDLNYQLIVRLRSSFTWTHALHVLFYLRSIACSLWQLLFFNTAVPQTLSVHLGLTVARLPCVLFAHSSLQYRLLLLPLYGSHNPKQVVIW